MCSLRSCTTTLRSVDCLQCFLPKLRLVGNPVSSTWGCCRVSSKIIIKQDYHVYKRNTRFTQCTSILCSLQKLMASHSAWRSLLFCSKWRCSLVGLENLTFHSPSKKYVQNNDTRNFSDTKMMETRKKVSKKMVEIKENILTIPNGLCFLRMVATPFLGYLVLQEWYATSLGLFIFAGCTDVVDGYIARNFPSQQSMIGSFLDPAADKILIATLFVTLTYNGLIPVPLTSLIILRDICLMGAGFYIRYVSLPPPKTLVRYFDMSFVTAKLSPTGISKVNTLVQLSLVACSLAAPVFGFVDHIYLQTLWYVTAVSTVVSAGSYLCYKDTYKVFASHMEERKK